MSGSLSQIVLMGLEANLIAALVLSLFRLRSHLGMAPLFLTIGAFQYLQLFLARSLFVELSQGQAISPSAVLFIASLFAVLLVYIWEDAEEARKLIYAIVLANLSVGVLSLLFDLHLDLPGARSIDNLPREGLQDIRVMLVGTAAILADVVLIILVYEALSKVTHRLLFLRLFTSMALVLAFDTLFFVTGSFVEERSYVPLLTAGLILKPAMALFYSLALMLYLRFVEHPGAHIEGDEGPIKDVFHALTYRQKYERIRKIANNDPLTGLYNRRYFESILPNEVERAKRYRRPTSLLLIDIDDFKRINDEHGHQEGDRALVFLATTLRDCVRSADVPCRIGGEEFAVVLPYADREVAVEVGERIRKQLAAGCRAGGSAIPWGPVTVTAGIACCPSETGDTNELMRLADHRLYVGKQLGRDRVVSRGRPIDARAAAVAR